jgi:DNA end-binding protein Ku
MARALWKGAITFGLVSIPVELYPAEDRKGFSFSMLDKRDFSPVGYKRYSKKSGKEVAWEDIIKGYEYEKGQYVVLSDEDFKRANVKATQTIDIKAFVAADEVPLQFYDTPYFLAPGPRGDKVYALLRDTLKATGRIAIAEVVIRTTPHLAAVVVDGKALMMNTLRYEDELRDPKGLDLPAEGKSSGVTAKEVALAKRLVDDMTEKWDPSQYKNTYHDDLMARIEEKIKKGETKEITKPEDDGEGEPRSAKVIDLAELLKQSLGGKKATKSTEKRAAASRGGSHLRVVANQRAAAKQVKRKKSA